MSDKLNHPCIARTHSAFAFNMLHVARHISHNSQHNMLRLCVCMVCTTLVVTTHGSRDLDISFSLSRSFGLSMSVVHPETCEPDDTKCTLFPTYKVRRSSPRLLTLTHNVCQHAQHTHTHSTPLMCKRCRRLLVAKRCHPETSHSKHTACKNVRYVAAISRAHDNARRSVAFLIRWGHDTTHTDTHTPSQN